MVKSLWRAITIYTLLSLSCIGCAADVPKISLGFPYPKTTGRQERSGDPISRLIRKSPLLLRIKLIIQVKGHPIIECGVKPIIRPF